MKLSRRSLLRRAAGTGAALVLVDVLHPIVNAGASTPTGSAQASAPSLFFLFGLRTADPTSGSFVAMGNSAAIAAGVSAIAGQVAAIPVRSPDRTVLAITGLAQEQSGTHLDVAYVDSASGAITRHGAIDLADVPSNASVLVTPTFAGDSVTLCLVLSITVPTDTRTITKFDPLTGGTLTLAAATWVSRHVLLYFNGSSGSFAGPFDLADAPSLARVNAAADNHDLFLWTIDEPAAVLRAKGQGAPAPVPQLSAFPLGSGTARFTTEAPGPWPVNGEPVAQLSTGDIGRLVYAKDLEVYSPVDGAATTIAIPQLDAVRAKPAATTMESRDDGLLFLAAPAMGRRRPAQAAA